MSSEKSDNFRRLAEARTNKIISSISLLGNLSNSSHYEYTEEQVDAMFSAIQEELKIQRDRFSKKSSKRKFRL